MKIIESRVVVIVETAWPCMVIGGVSTLVDKY